MASRDPVRAAPRTIAAPLAASAVLASVVAAYGVVLAAAALVLVTSTAPGGPWQDAGTVAVAGVVVQLVAQLCGAGFGLLLVSRTAALFADVALPMGCVVAAIWAIGSNIAGVVRLHGRSRAR